MGQILCIGPLYVDFNFTRFPSEGGLATETESSGSEYEIVPGGSAANFARVSQALGMRVMLGGKAGSDAMAILLSGMMKESDVELAIANDPEVLTELGMNFVSPGGDTVMAVAGTATESFNRKDLDQIVASTSSDLWLTYLGGCLKLGHLLPDLTELVHSLRQRGILVVLDHGRVPADTTEETLRSLRGLVGLADVYLPSHDEFLTVWRSDTVERAVDAVRGQAIGSPGTIAVKQGRAGAVVYERDRRVSHPGFAVNVRNTVGAGDSFNAGYVLGLQRGLGTEDCLDLACAVAALKISLPDLPDVAAIERFQEARNGARRPAPAHP